jgi:hypothetical protein
MKLGNVARVVAVLAGCVAAVGSATSTTNSGQPGQPAYNAQNAPPPPQQMEPQRALGLWRSTFGAVKIESDDRNGGLQAGNVQGAWMYQRQGQDVVGVFWGNLRGNVLQFHWQEPNNPPLTGEGFLVFDPTGRQYSGRWWSDVRDRVGEWNGWRQDGQGGQGPQVGGQDGGEMYGVEGGVEGGPMGGQGYAGSYRQPPPSRSPNRGYAPPPPRQPPSPPPSQPTQPTYY